MTPNLLPYIQVDFTSATHHRWRSGHVVDLPAVGSTTPAVTNTILWLTQKTGVVVEALDPLGNAKRRWHLAENTAFLWPMSLPRRIRTPEGGEWLSLSLRATLFDRINLFQWFGLPREVKLSAPEQKMMEEMMRQILFLEHGEQAPQVDYDSMEFYSRRLHATEEQGNRCARQWSAQSLAQAIFGLCWMACAPQIPEEPLQEETPLRLVKVLEVFDQEPSLKVSEAAQIAGFSSAQFRHLFQQWIGLPPQQYLHQRRMERARHLLETSDFPIGEVAYQLGFSSASHFTQAFKSTYDITPTRYRQSFLRSSV